MKYFQDTLVIKAPKKSPLILRSVVLLFSLVCGVYTCTIYLKQINPQTKSKFINIKVVDHDQSCRASADVDQPCPIFYRCCC